MTTPPADSAWWHRPGPITLLTALISAVLPAATGIQSWIEKQQAIDLAKLTADHEIRAYYVDKALGANLTVDEEEKVFSLLAKVKTDEILSTWASERLEVAVKQKEQLQKEQKELKSEKDELASTLGDSGRELLQLQASGQPNAPRISELQEEISKLEQQLRQKEVRDREIAAKIGEPTSQGLTNWFAVVASEYKWNEAIARATELQDSTPYPVEIYKATDSQGKPVFAVTVGGYLSQREARARVRAARESGLASDAFSHETTRWGESLLFK